MCGNIDCKKTYLVYFEEKDIYIAVGSVCIDKFYDGYLNNISCIERNGKCLKCEKTLVKRTSEKLGKMNCKRNRSICIECENSNKVSHKLYVPYDHRHFIKSLCIPVKYDQETQLWIYRGTHLPDILKQYELRYLNIPYEDKDYYKSKYSIKWDSKVKKWYTNTSIADGIHIWKR